MEYYAKLHINKESKMTDSEQKDFLYELYKDFSNEMILKEYKQLEFETGRYGKDYKLPLEVLEVIKKERNI